METTLLDCLQNCYSDCSQGNYGEGENPATMYARGIINGIVSATMTSTKCDFEEALRYVYSLTRKTTVHGAFDDNAIPHAWRDLWNSFE